ncbi:hypothetical protein T484DRAFT_1835751 [Baffinella frigidus]|nr:hypothetical protein T484DRAFT_1835751 [Cryptophyta sp. CCMP2293]
MRCGSARAAQVPALSLDPRLSRPASLPRSKCEIHLHPSSLLSPATREPPPPSTGGGSAWKRRLGAGVSALAERGQLEITVHVPVGVMQGGPLAVVLFIPVSNWGFPQDVDVD